MFRQRVHIHPYTNFLVKDGMQDIIEAARVGNDDYAATYMFWFLPTLEQEIKDELKEENQYFEAVVLEGKPIKRDELRDALGKVWSRLHEEGYFLGAKMKPKKETVGSIDDDEER